MPRQIQKNKYVDEFNFLYDLINEFTRKLDIDTKLFYFMVQKKINGTTHLHGFVYRKNGLSSNKELFKIYKNQNQIAEIAPYLASFSRLLSYIYHKAVSKVGEEKAEQVLEESFDHLKKKYSAEPNLEGYVPREAIGKAAAAAAAAAFDVSLMDNMLNYLLHDVIKKGITPSQKKLEEGRRESKGTFSSTEMKNRIRTMYVQALGPLGGKQYDKISQTLDFPVIQEQINGFVDKGILNTDKTNLFVESIRGILGVTEKHNPAKEIKKLYSETFGVIGEDLFREIESNLSYATVTKHITKLAKEKVIKEEEKNRLREKIKAVFGTS